MTLVATSQKVFRSLSVQWLQKVTRYYSFISIQLSETRNSDLSVTLDGKMKALMDSDLCLNKE